MSKMKMAETILCSSGNPMPALVTFTVLDLQPSESLCVTMAKMWSWRLEGKIRE